MHRFSSSVVVVFLAVAAVLTAGGLVGPGTAAAAPRCTDQINYAGDPRSNAILNSIGASTSQCPVPVPQAIGLPGYVRGAVPGGDCYNYPRYIFGESPGGQTLACVSQGVIGKWVRSVGVIGVRQIGSGCLESDGVAAQSPDGRPLVCSSTSGWVPGP